MRARTNRPCLSFSLPDELPKTICAISHGIGTRFSVRLRLRTFVVYMRSYFAPLELPCQRVEPNRALVDGTM